MRKKSFFRRRKSFQEDGRVQEGADPTGGMGGGKRGAQFVRKFEKTRQPIFRLMGGGGGEE